MTIAGLARLFVAACLVGLVLAALDAGDAIARLRAVEPGWVLASLAALTAQTLLSAWRWRLTAGRLGVHVAPRRAVAEYYLAQLVNQTVPGGMVGDVGRALRSSGEAGMMPAAQAVALERLMGNVMLMMVMVFALGTGWLMPSARNVLPASLWSVGIVALAVLAMGALVAASTGRGRVGRALAAQRRTATTALLAPSVLWRQLLLSLIAVLANLGAFYFAARATGVDLPPVAALVLTPLILFTMLIPITVSGWGLREGAAAGLFPLAGFSPEAGLAASIAFGLIFLLGSLPGLAVMVAGGPANTAARRVAAPPRPDI
ncbi:lysylphosphatidylglycerol synthase transmembrane domain-containing protein [Paracoccus salsus]|uniref:lysylphosphatidylglycerol synthase transmembrane domain-containing protein n=1 Tax=Paracoccus salsus TaxID=2911061 RepID=UPI001F328D00|nr:lysylphosphatidylglycerol synthase transmembrane domain-containing protein [Paracoccus salsus]MCF3972774.1 flippase-like domain-containing protein [Paracoccus salsus]